MRTERHETFGALSEEWDALADRSGAPPWVRPGWIRPWHEAFGTGTQDLIALRRDDGTLAALAPLQRKGRSLLAPANWDTPEFGLLAEDDDARSELVDALLDARPRRLQLSFLPPEGGGLKEVRAAAVARRYRLLQRVVESSPYIELDGGWESFLAGRERVFVKELVRRRRRLGEQGEITFELLDGRERLDELLAEGFAIEASGWKGENGTAIVSTPATLAFYTAVARWAAGRGWLRLGCLRLDGALIAFELNLEEGGRWYSLKGGYDESFRRFGPGQLISEDIIRTCFERGLRSFEFLGNDDAYKLDWTSTSRDRILVQAFSPSLPGIVDHCAYAVGRPLAKRLLVLRGRGRGS